MTMRFSCWSGRHDLTTRVEQGESDTVCSKCGKTPRGAEKHIAHQAPASSYSGYSPDDGGGGHSGIGGQTARAAGRHSSLTIGTPARALGRSFAASCSASTQCGSTADCNDRDKPDSISSPCAQVS